MKNTASRAKNAFSLVEVVVAVGIFALAIVGVIGLLSPTNKAVADVADSDAAARAISAIQSGLQQSGFSAVQANLVASNVTLASTDYKFYCTKNGDKVGLISTLTTTADKGTAFFEFALIRNGDSPTTGAGLSPAANDTTAGFLAFTISLRWPAYLANGNQFTAHEQKSVMIVPAAVTR